MFGPRFGHYLSYGATDQQTVIALTGSFDGLLVPGTVAAFQRQGTGGFVLSLTAAIDEIAYAIDPRFPLFQQALLYPKKSHEALAGLLGVPALIRDRRPLPNDFSREVIEVVAREWARFNNSYPTVAGAKFKKYAERLGKALPVSVDRTKMPDAVLAPYLIASSTRDPWWRLSRDLFDATAAAVSYSPCIRVVATERAAALRELLADVDDSNVVIWVSGLDELTTADTELAEYGAAIRASAMDGKRMFALYGGFFSVLLGNMGLIGSSHGIGYGEQREWIELPESGPPPARYYVPQLHRYLQPDEATRLLLADERLARCTCPECEGDFPNTLEYHALMRHSVYCRAQEIAEWSSLSLQGAASRLESEYKEWRGIVLESSLADVLKAAVMSRATHFDRWLLALSKLSDLTK